MLEVARAAGIISWDKTIKYGKNQSIVFSDEFMNELLGYEDLVISRTFHDYLLIDTPLAWKADSNPSRLNASGGYHLPELRRNQRLCRSYDSDSVFGEKAVDLLNTLQKAAWRVDDRILAVAEVLNEKRIPVKSFLVATIDKPEKGNAPQHIVDDPEKLKQWKSDRHELHRSYRQQTKKAYRTRQVLSMAKEFEFKTYFLSWSLDWRGRFYSQQSWLTPLSTDFEKSLMKFRDGCKLNAEALDWCKSALGAAYNGTRISFQQRIQWTGDNAALLKRIADDPLSSIAEWEVAKDPWQFLQLCFEWNDVVVTQKEKFWKVPVGADSTASGLQLLSAMRRDPVGMKYANLLEPETPSSAPQDAYMRVLEVAKGIASNDDELKRLVPYLDYRGIGKPAVMLSVYGGCHRNIKEDIEDAVDEIKKELEAQGLQVDKSDMSKLTTLITKASKQVFPAAYEALSWLKRLAKQAHKDGQESLTWTTPTNDQIHLVKYALTEAIKIYTAFNGTVNIRDFNKEEPDTTRQVSSFAPSFVHCYDAALLKEAFSDWSYPIAVIHDCIRVLPSDMDRAMDRIRDAFTSIVVGDPLARLADDLDVDSSKLKRLLQLEQDLSAVQHSKYMFN
jgi:DNA-directed RNA polymerase